MRFPARLLAAGNEGKSEARSGDIPFTDLLCIFDLHIYFTGRGPHALWQHLTSPIAQPDQTE